MFFPTFIISKVSLLFLLGAITLYGQSSQHHYFFSNDPEGITAPGMVFRDFLSPLGTRLLYYHKNGMQQDLFVRISLHNPTTTAISIHVKCALGGPDSDGLYAGHQSTKRYLDPINGSDVETVSILPGKTLNLVYQKLKPSMVSTGIIEFFDASSSIQLDMTIIDPLYVHLSPLNEENDNAYHVQKVSAGVLNFEQVVDVSNPIYVFGVGRDGFLKDNNGEPLVGNYGVIYEGVFSFKNPTLQYKKVAVYFSPAGGVARGVMLLNNQFIETDLIHPQQKEKMIFSFVLAPGEQKMIPLKMLPQAGSNYPVDIVFQSKDHGMIWTTSTGEK